MAATAKPRRNVAARPAESVRTEVDSRRLAAELASNLRGEVRFDAGSRALYAKDYSVYRHLPIGVVIPTTSPMSSRPSRCAGSMVRRSLPAAVAPAPTGSAATWPW
jgi:hypothetical protein